MRTLKEEEDPLGGGVILSLSLQKSVALVSLIQATISGC